MTVSATEQYNDNYETCERAVVRLRIYTGDVSPEEITVATGLTPSRVTRKGEVVTRSEGRSRVSPRNAWFLDTESHVNSRDLRRHIDWMLTSIKASRISVAQLRENGCEVDFLCIWWSKYNTGGPIIWPRQLIEIGLLGLECIFEFAFFDEEPERIEK